MSCSEAVKSGEAVEGDEADEGLPVDSDAVQFVEALNAVGLKFLERRLCQHVHSAVCIRPAANRTRL